MRSLLFAVLLPAIFFSFDVDAALYIPPDVFSLDDLQGADNRTITSLHVFGDSYSDNCNSLRFLIDPIASSQTKWPKCYEPPFGRADKALSWPEIIQQKFRPDWDVFVYAVSAATCDSTKFFQGSLDFNAQIALFTTRYGNDALPHGLQDDPASAVAAVLIGGNDISLIMQQSWGTLAPGSYSLGDVEDSAACVRNGLQTLHFLGFRRFLLIEQPPIDKGELLGSTPDHQAATATVIRQHNMLTRAFAANLTQEWNDGSTISIFPLYKLLDGMVTLNPAYQLKHGAGTYCNSTCRYPFDYAWTDNIHVSYRAFELMANAIVRFLVPSPGPLFGDID